MTFETSTQLKKRIESNYAIHIDCKTKVPVLILKSNVKTKYVLKPRAFQSMIRIIHELAKKPKKTKLPHCNVDIKSKLPHSFV